MGDDRRPKGVARGTVVWGVTGGIAAGAAGVLAWCLLHPRTDYPGPLVLVPAGFAGGLVAGAVVGGIVRAIEAVIRRPGAGRYVAFALAAAATLAALRELDPTDRWAFPAGHDLPLATAAGALVFVLLTLALVVRGRFVPVALAAPVVVATVLAEPGPLPSDPTVDGPRAVLFITIDTLRADHLGCYGYERPTSPRIDALAGESVLFERAFSPMPSTDPSHVAELTGLYPRESGVLSNSWPITRPGVVSIASWFEALGYRTGAITSRAHLHPERLRLPGFQTFSVPTDDADWTNASEALRRTRLWLDRHGDAPFFLWLHVWDPHGSYEPPREPERSMFVGEYHGPIAKRGKRGGPPSGTPYPPGVLDYATGLYDGEIRYADDHVGLVLEEMRERYGRENVLVVLSADHGETLGEMDETYAYAVNHSHFATRSEVHVPLLISWPGVVPEGVRVERPVTTVGIAGTIAGLVASRAGSDIAKPFPFEVPDLLAFLEDPTATGEPVFVGRREFLEAPRPYLVGSERGVVDGDWLYIENEHREGGRMLYDCRRDPRNEVNLVGQEPEVSARLAAWLRTFLEDHPRVEPDPGEADDHEQ